MEKSSTVAETLAAEALLAEESTPSTSGGKRNIIACIMGNVIEWYEFSLYAYLAPVIAVLFFPAEDKLAGLLLTFLVFALGFIIRPLGSVVLGHLGDCIGRVRTLKITIFLLSISTIITGFLPTYQHIGIYSPLLLMLCRLFQGLCVGGEFAGAMIYLTESAPAKRRGLVSCMANNGSNIGVLLAISGCAVLSYFMTPTDFALYGWRLLFIVGGAIGIVGLWLRRDVSESEVFNQLQKKLKEKYVPLKYVFQYQRWTMTKIALLLFISASGSYTLMSYISTYLNTFLGVPLNKAYLLQILLIVFSLLFVPIFAYLSDYYGRRSIILLAAVGYIFFALPVVYLLQSVQAWWVLLPLIICYSAEQAVVPVTIVEMFPGKGRYTGISIPYNITMALVGGTSPLLNTYLIEHFNNNLMIAYYLMLCAFIALLVVLFSLPKNYGVNSNLANPYTHSA